LKILVATGNRAKFREMRDILREHGIEAERVDVDYPELQSDSLEEIAAHGARYCAESLGKPVIVEDSGLFVDALNGFPGPYSAGGRGGPLGPVHLRGRVLRARWEARDVHRGGARADRGGTARGGGVRVRPHLHPGGPRKNVRRAGR